MVRDVPFYNIDWTRKYLVLTFESPKYIDLFITTAGLDTKKHIVSADDKEIVLDITKFESEFFLDSIVMNVYEKFPGLESISERRYTEVID